MEPFPKTINTSNLSLLCIQYFNKAVLRKYWFIAIFSCINLVIAPIINKNGKILFCEDY